MTMADYIEELTKKRREKDVRKGRAEVHAEWRAWNERRLQAEARGEPFDESIPGAEESHDRQ